MPDGPDENSLRANVPENYGTARSDSEVEMTPFDSNDLKEDWVYRNAFTIDPSEVDKAWETLTTNEFAARVGMLPKIFHNAMLKTLKESGVLERIGK